MLLLFSKNDETPQCANTNGVSNVSNPCEKTNMSSVQNNELTFQQTAFHPVSHAGETWLTSSELAAALGYKKSDAVTQIYSRYHDEFSEKMSTTLKMSVVRKTGAVDIPVRVFSLRGCHLIAMFATTDKAKEFRRWVLDILDREVAQGNVNPAFDFKMHVHNINVACIHLDAMWDIWSNELNPALRALGSPIATKMVDRLKDSCAQVNGVRGGMERASGLKGLQYH
ncbi:Rha family phage protein [Buttiauxella gaviniae ATCC 51604]|uniref:Rha family phage protein n=2 Tax=Buttiauxella gaviniae TaxID=82990 RepID=A0A1B7I670_9ENTR|nr:Rha family phage protein [Buttiauxella gaviniae ATCC 51604]